jgi:hypothetical protein
MGPRAIKRSFKHQRKGQVKLGIFPVKRAHSTGMFLKDKLEIFEGTSIDRDWGRVERGVLS